MNRTALRHSTTDGLRLVDEPLPELAPGEASIDVLAVGLCGTDTHILEGNFPSADNVIMGHEVCGVVRELADDSSDLAVGDLVTVEPHKYCTACTYCRSGDEHLCINKKGYGVKLDGGMTTTMIAPARILYRLDPQIDPLIGAMAEPLACCIHSMDRLNPTSGTSILISGCGPAGAMLVALSKARGLTPIVVSEPSESRRELALKMGADLAVHPDELDSPEVATLAGEQGFHSVVDAVGRAAIARDLLNRIRKGGTFLVFGVAAPDDALSLTPREVYDKELTIVGSIINPYTHERAVAMLQSLPLEAIPTRTFPLTDYEAAFVAQREGREKIYLVPNRDNAKRLA
ncbi:alcohol dehydrogenase catalytic domain-containing protein [Paramicrobacterium agarici]|uniref:Threonine dehydrogenase-like Zn-dependent dehydrogenase n=1 Tax=Paramicrobacterium agarici TaxID=630514 RepID=A0A2A9DU67_9MICO|nr:alcohol dehydrogenase catalytic domain-containing protein [Microbacterium agarici]PFG29906.1 threonine dehydrogenase-like Zn-dependent dehydrogenase [Microbacterium agarici]